MINGNTPLQYFCDNRNFKESRKCASKKVDSDVLQVVDGRIVINTNLNRVEDDEVITSHTYMKKKPSAIRWNSEDTSLFYNALEVCGCDFSLMNLLFTNKTRSNIRDKYKKEMKSNREKVENSLKKFRGFDQNEFEKIKERMGCRKC